MKRCEHTSQLTAYLLGDLPERDAAAVAGHLAACAACRATADALRETLALLREALPADDGKGEQGPVLDAARREALLAVRPERAPTRTARWFLSRHPALKAAAAIALLATVLVSTVRFLAEGVLGGMAASAKAVSGASTEAVCEVTDTMRTQAADARSLGLEYQKTIASAGEDDGSAPILSRDSAGWSETSAAQKRPSGPAPHPESRTETMTASRNLPVQDKKAWKDAEAPAAAPAPTTAPTVGRRLARLKEETAAPDVSVVGRTGGQRYARYDADSDVKHKVEPAAKPAEANGRADVSRSGLTSGGAAANGAASLGQTPVGYRSLGSPAAPAQPEGKVRLNIDVPKPQFTGTPKDIRSPNLEAAGTRSVGPFTSYGLESALKAKAEAKPVEEAGALEIVKLLTGAGKVTDDSLNKPVIVLDSLVEAPSWDFNGGAAATALADKLPRADEVKAVAGEPADLYAGAKFAVAKQQPALPVNPFVEAAAQPFSTFAMDVDTASYTLTRQALRAGALPEPERVRTEEIVNAFDYGDTAPDRTVFRVYQGGAQSPFGAGLHLLRIGVKGRRLGREEQRPAVLTFVIDVSGSMSQPDRIGFARQALSSLLEQLGATDRIQLIAYSDHARLVLEPVPASEKARVLAAFEQLQCNGSTNLEEGMRLAYEQAAKGFVPGAENRVILLSDGVANLGADSAQEILAQVAASRKQGITCSVFGVGAGTYNDRLLEELANKGDGVYRFLDSEEAVRSAFVDDLAATLNTIAKDAKIQVEWNPAAVRRYRQLGYENRALTKEQFRDDAVDAGEVGSGQSVTALYELELSSDLAPAATLGTVRVRYQRTDTGKVEEIEAALVAETVLRPAHAAGAHFRVASCAAEFAELLRGSPHAAGGRFDAVADYLRPAALELSLDTRVSELLGLVEAAAALK